MVVDLPHLVFTYIARKAAKQEWNSKKKKGGTLFQPPTPSRRFQSSAVLEI
jgi:hypothetical protein